MKTETETERTTLFYREGSSDKLYQASIEPAGNLFVVNFAYGRRGSTLSTGTKTGQPLEYKSAKSIFDKLVREKKAKGYTEAENGTPYQHSGQEGTYTGTLPQLLNPMEEEDLEIFLQDQDWCLQEKLDGRRMLIRKEGDEITGINRKGMIVSLPCSLASELRQIQQDYVLDGESIGDDFHMFDLMEIGGKSIRSLPYRERMLKLISLKGAITLRSVHYVEPVVIPKAKRSRFEALLVSGHEGVVFKNLDAPSIPGRPESGGTQLKYKFYSTLSARVAHRNDGRSVRLDLQDLDGQTWASCGNVSIPANHPIPAVGAIVEVRYLYAFPESGALFQPTYLGLRPDLAASDCLKNQVKFKRAENGPD